MSKLVNVRFNENSVYATRSYGVGEEHVISEADAKALGSSVTVLGDAPVDFPNYDKSVYGDNEAAKKREPQDPADVEPVSVGHDDPNDRAEVVGDEKNATAPENKMIKGAPKQK